MDKIPLKTNYLNFPYKLVDGPPPFDFENIIILRKISGSWMIDNQKHAYYLRDDYDFEHNHCYVIKLLDYIINEKTYPAGSYSINSMEVLKHLGKRED